MNLEISATFTAEPIEPALSFWISELGYAAEIRFGGYGQVFQQLLDPAGAFARNAGGINVALVRFDDWPGGQAAEFVGAVRSAVMTAPLIVGLCPSKQDCTSVVHDGLSSVTGVHVITAGEISDLYPVSEIHDAHADQLGHVPYTAEYFAALATAVARKIHAIRTPPFKVIALDCDDTLWSGICGEDGPQAVVIDEPRRKLQEFMAARRHEGMLLALCSKNNEEDVAETFRAHPAMPLAWTDFAARRINWESKGANLSAIADELELGLDSVILVDDSAKEADEAHAGAPTVLTLALPAHSSNFPDFLRHVWAFDRAQVTDEDRRRPELYAQRAARVEAEQSASSLQEFLASLDLQVQIAPIAATDVDRVAQLTQRTNQMNATCMRRSAAEIQRLSAECLTVRVTDRFGSYGLTGAIVFRLDGAALVVDTFLLSCRALGRGVEHRMIARLGEIAVERGLSRVEIPFLSGQRNRPAWLFLNSLGDAGTDGVFRLEARKAAAVAYEPEAPPPHARASRIGSDGTRTPETEPLLEARRLGSGAWARPDYARIATRLRTPAQVLEQLRTRTRRAGPVANGDSPRTALERDLAALWSELLDISAVGIHDNFFEIGGHSLLAVQLLSRVRQIYGVDLSLEVVYSGEFTVAELAKAVELKEIEQSGGDYQELLAELEGLTDEQVRALLAEEQDAD
ncbi:MAG TPA: HAD-IIIC family phosphatase [Candidatus Solibacter sp.]|nr:HAD-IIIC family phosphatase [Candidatus Solibacter sp.]